MPHRRRYVCSYLLGNGVCKMSTEAEIIAEFGEEVGRAIIESDKQITEHCRRNKITSHSINADGSCNMGCC